MPISILTVMTMPKCTGSIPSFIATGNMMGAMISTIDDGSITLPASSSSTLTNNRNATWPRPLSSIHAAMTCGICSDVIRNENMTALVIM